MEVPSTTTKIGTRKADYPAFAMIGSATRNSLVIRLPGHTESFHSGTPARSNSQIAAIDWEYGSSCPGGFIAGKVDGQAGHILRYAETPDGMDCDSFRSD